MHWPRTLLAKQRSPLRREHLRFHRHLARTGALHCFLLDGSASMSHKGGLARTAALLRHLLQLVYQQRGQIAIVSFAGARATTRVSPTAARPATSRTVEQWLRAIDTGGSTPFAHGVRTADSLLQRAAQRDPAQQRWLWVLTDGRSNERPPAPRHADVKIFIDCEQQRVSVGRCAEFALAWDAECSSIDDWI